MKTVLFFRDDERLFCRITAELQGGSLVVSGQDIGPQVEEFFGRDEYEYCTSLDRENTRKLFEELGCRDQTEAEKLAEIKRRFHGNLADTSLEEFCRRHNIETSFWSWP